MTAIVAQGAYRGFFWALMTTDVLVIAREAGFTDERANIGVVDFVHKETVEPYAKGYIDAYASIDTRLHNLEKVAHAPVDLTQIAYDKAVTVARIFEADPHQFSSRPCQTCRAVSAIIGQPFGCEARRK